MTKTQINCPNCGQSIIAEVDQILDVNTDPSIKTKLLSGHLNSASCGNCGFVGMLASPLVYHDPEKELLLTFVPQDLNLPRDEQDKIVGPMISRIMDSLEPEKRKGYLFSPVQVLTFQGLVEKVLEADGVTKEMLEAQNEKLVLLEKLLSANGEDLDKLIEDSDSLIDQELFAILANIIQGTVNSNDEESAQKLANIQESLLRNSTYGKRVKQDIEELQTAASDLRSLGNEISREEVLELLEKNASVSRTRAIAQLIRPIFDYEFFQLLSSKIDQAQSGEKETLIQIREELLEVTKEIDDEIQMRTGVAKRNIDALLNAENMEQALRQNINSIDEFFVQVLREELDTALELGNEDRSSKIKQIFNILDELSSGSHKMRLIEELINLIDNDKEFDKAVDENAEDFNDEFVQMLTGLVTQFQEAAKDPNNVEHLEYLEKLQRVYRRIINLKMTQAFSK